MKVIIFTMAYNAENTIKRTIESILNQTFSNFEYYILDNASTDNTFNVIEKYSKKDKRIVALRVNKNDPPNGGAFFRAITYATNADYIVWCDADDTYSPTFLEETTKFATDNQLDIVSCGYDKVDGYTGKIIKHRVLDENLILYGNLFTEEFVKYRGFTLYLWGKLYSVPFLKSNNLTGTVDKEQICNDSIWTLNIFRVAKRAGVYGKAMYQYYQYSNSLSNQNIEMNLASYRQLWLSTKKYLQSYGPISRLNEDFLYAINFSIVDEVVNKIFASSKLNIKSKLNLLENVFDDPTWARTLSRNADPQFRNLAQKHSYVLNVKNRISALPGIEEYENIRSHIFSYLKI